jgi:high-affinity Fe2+/Pb2+ permease
MTDIQIIACFSVVISALLFLLGIWVGAEAEAAVWRGKAMGPQRKESKGKLYRVTHEFWEGE